MRAFGSAMRTEIKNNAAGWQTLGMAVTGFGVALGAMAAISVKTFASFEQTMRNVQSVAGATDDQFVLMTEHAKELGETTVFTARQAGDAMYLLASAGFSAEQQMASTAAILDLAAATQADLSQATALTVSTLKAFGLEAKDAGRATNVFAATIASSQANMARLSVAMPIVSASFNQLGFSVETASAALGILFDRGLQASTAGTRLRLAVNKLLDVTPKAAAAIRNLGIKIEDVNPATNSLVDIVRQFETAGLDAASAAKIFGVRAEGMTLLVSAGADELERYTAELTGTNKAAELATIQLDTLVGDIKLLKSAVEGAAISLGEGLAPAIRGAARLLTELVGKFNALPQPIKAFTATVVGATAAMALFAGSGILLLAQLPKIGLAYKALSGAVLTARIALLEAGGAMAIFGTSAGVAGLAIVTLGSVVWATKRIYDALTVSVDNNAVKLEHNKEINKDFREGIEEVTVALEDWKRLGIDPTTAVLGQLVIDIGKLNKKLNSNFTIFTKVDSILRALGRGVGDLDTAIKDTTVSSSLFAVANNLLTRGLLALGGALQIHLRDWEDVIDKFDEWRSITGEGWQATTDQALDYFETLRDEGLLSGDALLVVNRKIIELEKKKVDELATFSNDIFEDAVKLAQKEIDLADRKAKDFAAFNMAIFEDAAAVVGKENKIREDAIEKIRVAGLTERELVIEKYAKLEADALAHGDVLVQLRQQMQDELDAIDEKDRQDFAAFNRKIFEDAARLARKEIGIADEKAKALAAFNNAVFADAVMLAQKEDDLIEREKQSILKFRALELDQQEARVALFLKEFAEIETLFAKHGGDMVALEKFKNEQLEELQAEHQISFAKIAIDGLKDLAGELRPAVEDLFEAIFSPDIDFDDFLNNLGRSVIRTLSEVTTSAIFGLVKKGAIELFSEPEIATPDIGIGGLPTELEQSEDATQALSSGMSVLSISADGLTTSIRSATLAIQEYTAAAAEAGLLEALAEIILLDPGKEFKVTSAATGRIATQPEIAIIGDNPGGRGEAVIPIPSGGRIPVELTGRGRGGGGIHIENFSLEMPNSRLETVTREEVRSFMREKLAGVIMEEITSGRLV